MILDLGSFTRRGLMVNHVCPLKKPRGGTKHLKSRGCKTRKEVSSDFGIRKVLPSVTIHYLFPFENFVECLSVMIVESIQLL